MSQTIDLELTAMAHGGSALGRHEGRVIFVPYTIPGETVRVELVEARTRWGRGRLLEVLEPSPQRAEPPCPYFGPGKCGGCHFQHIGYEAQAEYKREVVIDQLARLGGLHEANVHEIIGAAEPWAYRNHAQLSTTPEGQLGFLTADTHHVVPVGECLILDPIPTRPPPARCSCAAALTFQSFSRLPELQMAGPAGIEPTASGFGDRRSAS